MPEYQLELKQIVEYPRCRIYRQFIRSLMDDRSIRTSGGSGLFYFTVLCSHANYTTSYKQLRGINHTIYPGEWVCRISELSEWFRTRFQHQALAILELLQKQNLVTYTILGHGGIVKYRVKGWRYFNTIVDSNAPCQKNTGFFFLPISKASEIISTERCSEMDIMLDLWMQTIYNDEQVEGSDVGPVVYIRNGSGSPLIRYADLAKRWGLSKITVGRILRKFEEKGYISVMTFPDRHGSVLYLKNYLSTMFQISDVMVDKEEITMSLNLRISIPEEYLIEDDVTTVSVKNICIKNEKVCVSESHIQIIVQKVLDVIATQGICCGDCVDFNCKLSPLFPGCNERFNTEVVSTKTSSQQINRFIIEMGCDTSRTPLFFEIHLIELPTTANAM